MLVLRLKTIHPSLHRLLRMAFCIAASCLLALALSSERARSQDASRPLSPEEAARTMVVPEGFHVTAFAGEPDVQQPVGFCIDDRGRLWVAEAFNYPRFGTQPGDRIVILEDANGDGKFDKRTVFFDQLNYVTGIEVGFGGVWVMSPPKMYFLPDRNGDDVPTASLRSCLTVSVPMRIVTIWPTVSLGGLMAGCTEPTVGPTTHASQSPVLPMKSDRSLMAAFTAIIPQSISGNRTRTAQLTLGESTGTTLVKGLSPIA